jgi:serine/threonine-protein kinase RsbT
VIGWEQALLSALNKYVPDVLADSMLRRARSAAGHPPDFVRAREELRSSVRLFVDSALQPTLLAEVDAIIALPPDVQAATAERVEVTCEADVSRARIRARELSLGLRGSAFGVQRASTAVSELARNMFMYAGGGRIELVPVVGPPALLTVRAVDTGPGIADVNLVLGGQYRSRTGLGRGLRGVKLLAARFDVRTGPRGTRIEADIAL